MPRISGRTQAAQTPPMEPYTACPTHCEHCGSTMLYKHRELTQDIDSIGYLTYWKCVACAKHHFGPITPCLDPT